MHPGAMQLVLRDTNPHVVLAWTQVFGGAEDVTFGVGDLLRAGVDAVVSPANSFGYMDGGIDLHYRHHFGLKIEARVQAKINRDHGGELPVGEAFVVPTGDSAIRRLVVAPTMYTPRNIQNTDNVERAMLAALRAAAAIDNPPIARLGTPGMGTGVGRLHPEDAAEQMFAAWSRWRGELDR